MSENTLKMFFLYSMRDLTQISDLKHCESLTLKIIVLNKWIQEQVEGEVIWKYPILDLHTQTKGFRKNSLIYFSIFSSKTLRKNIFQKAAVSSSTKTEDTFMYSKHLKWIKADAETKRKKKKDYITLCGCTLFFSVCRALSFAPYFRHWRIQLWTVQSRRYQQFGLWRNLQKWNQQSSIECSFQFIKRLTHCHKRNRKTGEKKRLLMSLV